VNCDPGVTSHPDAPDPLLAQWLWHLCSWNVSRSYGAGAR
jgi:hypothetical protein